jgi:hypothetical protein
MKTERIVAVGSEYEKCVVGSLLTEPSLFGKLNGLTHQHFLAGPARTALQAIERLTAQGEPADVASVLTEVRTMPGGDTDVAWLVDCIDGVMPESFPRYVREVRQAANERALAGQLEAFQALTDPQEKVGKLKYMLKLCEDAPTEDFLQLFHSEEQIQTSPPLTFRINQFLQAHGVSFIGGLAGHGKTFTLLSIARALLTGECLFGHEAFSVPELARRVIYLIPESSLGPFVARLRMFGLDKFAGNSADSRLLIQTLSSEKPIVDLEDSMLLKAAEGADIILDTATRFKAGDENDAGQNRPFASALFALLNAKAESITGAHHSPKDFSKADHMTLENCLRGSGDLGAMLCGCWGIRQIDAERNRIFVQNLKARDFDPCQPFILEGRPHLEHNGNFFMELAPGHAGELTDHLKNKGGRPESEDKPDQVARMISLRADGKGVNETAKIIGCSNAHVSRCLKRFDDHPKGEA